MIDTRTAPYAAFVLRLVLGLMFISHALLKYLVPAFLTVAAVVQALLGDGQFALSNHFAQKRAAYAVAASH